MVTFGLFAGMIGGCGGGAGSAPSGATQGEATAALPASAASGPTRSGAAMSGTSGIGIPPVRTTPVHNQGPRNGLDPCALRRNKALLDRLRTGPLTTAAANEPEVSSRLPDEDTRGLIQYIVSCANDPAAPPVAPATQGQLQGKYLPPWKGEMGLCGSTSPWPWTASGPPPACQEIVSACVLARVNKLGRRVMISTRGEPANLFPLSSEIPVETTYRDGAAARSLAPCALGTTDCGFSARRVGRCEAGHSVVLTATGAAPGTSLRVCKGLHACHPGDAGLRHYSQWIADSAPGAPGTLTFTCPDNGPLLGGVRTGYYGVLVKSGASPDPANNPALAGVRPLDVTASEGAYPASEAEVFTYREGAFFGNVFDTAALAPRGDKDPCGGAGPALVRALGGNELACFSEIWSDGLAYANDRWCAGTSCFENAPLPCLFDVRTTTQAANRACDGQSPPPGAFYDRCRGGQSSAARYPWQHPVTVYLNHPCDTITDKASSCGGWSGEN